MRILILNTFPIWGGDEKWTINVGKGLSERGHHVVISSRPGSETEKRAQENGLTIFPFHIGPDIAFWKIRPFQKYLKGNDIEVVLCVQNRNVKVGGLAARLAGIKAIFGRQGLNTINKKKLFHKIAWTRFVDGIITNTNSIKELYHNYRWFKDDFIHVVYDGLKLPDNLLKINLHKEFDLKPGSKVIIGTGRLGEQKRFDLLIEVAVMAKNQKSNWSIIVVGKGKLEMKLKKMATDFGVDHIIKFVGFRNDVLTLMNSADLFVLSSDYEGMSNALREAMAVGKACVATNVFGVDELFQNGKSGLKVKKGDSTAIYNAIENIFSNPNLKRNMEKNAADLIKSVFTMEKMIDNIEQLFIQQLEKNR